MNVVVKRGPLVDALSILERVASASSAAAPVLACVLLRADKGLLLRATDLEAMAEAGVSADVEASGATVVEAKLLFNLARRLSGDTITLRVEDKRLVVSGGGAKFSLASMPADEYPMLPGPDSGSEIRISARALARSLRSVAVAAAQSDQRPVLSAVFLEYADGRLELAATDSSRLAYTAVMVRDGGPSSKLSAIIPIRAVGEIARICDRAPEAEDAVLVLGERVASVEAAGIRLVTRLVDGIFPPFRQVFLVDAPVQVEFPRAPMLAAIERLSLLARRGPAVVRLESNDGLLGGVKLYNAEADIGEGEEVVELVNGTWPDGLSIAYQARFLADALKATESDSVTYKVGDPTSRCQVEAGGVTHIIMPVRMA